MTATLNLELIDTFLQQYGGGEISLLKDFWDDGIALMCINHQEKRNALSGKMLTDLNKCIHEIENWENGKAIILFGKGTNFCSGGDLDFARQQNNSSAGLYMSHYMHDILKRFRKLPLVSVCLAHGAVLGGGAELCTFADYLLVADNTKLGFIHGKMGIMTAWGGGTRLTQIVGQRKSLEILLSSKIYSPQELLDLGLAYKILDTNTMMEKTLDFVRSLTSYHSSIIRSYKVMTNAAVDEKFETALELEKNEFYPKWGSALNKEALSLNIKHVKN